MIAVDGTRIAIAVVLGGGFGLGVVLLLSLAPRWGAHSLSRRIAPYIRDVADVPGFGPALTAMPATAGAGLRALADRAGRLFGGAESLERRLNQAGWTMDAAAFRARQLGWGIAGLGAGAVAAVALALLGRSSGALVLLAPIAALTFVVARRRAPHARGSCAGRADRRGTAHCPGVPGAVPLGRRGHPRLAAAGRRGRCGRADR